MVKRKNSPRKHSPKKARTGPYLNLCKGFKFTEDIEPSIGVHILNLLGLWNYKAAERIPGDETVWNETMEIKPTHSKQCFGLFAKSAVPAKKIIALMKGEMILSLKGSKKTAPATCYDIQPMHHCTYTCTRPDGTTTVHELDCYIKGTGDHEAFNGQLCNHTCSKADQNCMYVGMEPVKVSLRETDRAIHTLCLPVIGIQTIKDVPKDYECLVDYGEHMFSDREMEGFIPCLCTACVQKPGRFIMG